jgi:hypothetical protein
VLLSKPAYNLQIIARFDVGKAFDKTGERFNILRIIFGRFCIQDTNAVGTDIRKNIMPA